MANTSPDSVMSAVHVKIVDRFGQETRDPIMFEKLPVEHRLVGNILVTSFCDRIQFVNLGDKTKHSSPKLLPCSSPHLVSGDEARDDILYSCQDTASNNLMAVSLEELEMNV